MKTLVVIDMQNDLIYGVLGTPEAQEIVPKVAEKIKNNDGPVYATQDYHIDSDFMSLQESRFIPPHCIVHYINDECIVKDGTKIHKDIAEWLEPRNVFRKRTFTCMHLPTVIRDDWTVPERSSMEIEIVGLCTDICVISTALMLRSEFPRTKITVDASCCAGTTPEKHKAALEVMKSCCIDVINE